MSVVEILGILSIICALLIIKDKKRYKWLIKPVGLDDSAKFAATYYSIMGLLMLLGSFISNSYLNGFVIPILVITFSAIMSGIIIVKKQKDALVK